MFLIILIKRLDLLRDKKLSLLLVPIKQLTGVVQQPVKRGPASTLQRQMEQIDQMPRGKQKFISEMLDALIKPDIEQTNFKNIYFTTKS